MVWFLFVILFRLKTMRQLKYPGLVLMTLIALASCRKIQQLSPVPHIEYTSFAIFDTTDILGNKSQGGRLKFYFEDGDGDLGLNAPGIGQGDSTNLFFTLYRKVNGIMVQAQDNDPLKPSAYRIPYMDRLGQNKILKGTIAVTFIYLTTTPADTIRYDFYIKDRAQNESNVVSTKEIIPTVPNTY